VAEGVETEDNLRFLCQRECDSFQGYLFSPPLSAADFSTLLESRPGTSELAGCCIQARLS
jgi:diguanylate cyclase